MDNRTLTEVVRDNLKELRENKHHMNKTEFAKLVRLKRTSYLKKENGVMGILINDLDNFMKYLNVGIGDLLKGHPAMVVQAPAQAQTPCPTETTSQRFPFLKRLVELATDIATTQDTENAKEDLKVLRDMFEGGVVKLDKELSVKPYKGPERRLGNGGAVSL